MSTAITLVEDKVLSLEGEFNKINSYQINFKKESLFALNILKNNSFLLKTAQEKPDSLEQAIMNIAAIGITLNPAQKEAYLVPRGGQVCLDISYMGLVKLATDTGSVIWVQAEIVKENDQFEYLGMGVKPLHKFHPFKERGAMIGAYCTAKLASGEFLTTVMSKAEIEEVRKTSKAGTGPWNTFYDEMAKKTVIKRASKLWPKSERIQTAVDVLNQHEGIDFKQTGSTFTPEAREEAKGEDAGEKIRELLATYGKSEDGLIKYINTQFKTEIKTIEEMTPEMIESSFRVLGA